MSLRDRLAGKPRRAITVPVQVSDPGPARGAFDEAERKHTLLSLLPDTTPAHRRKLTAAKRDRDKAREALAEHFVEVDFQAASQIEVEAVMAGHLTKDGDWDDQTGLPVLAALCAVDEDLRDPQWWAEQLGEQGSWSTGERASLWTRLVGLNLQAPPEALPKG